MQKENIYYLVVVIGILALTAMIIVNNVQSKRQEELAKQKIELTGDDTKENTIHQTIGEVSKNTSEAPAKEEAKEAQADIIPANSNATTAVQTVTDYDGKTKMEWPLVGNVILPYSMDTTIYFQTLDQYKCNPGMMIQAAEGAEVSNVFNGKVTSVKKDDKLGNLVTVDIGGGYQVQYGQLEEVKLQKGDSVDTGMIIGKVAAPTDFFAKEGTNLYFALTKDKKPINPMDYLK